MPDQANTVSLQTDQANGCSKPNQCFFITQFSLFVSRPFVADDGRRTFESVWQLRWVSCTRPSRIWAPRVDLGPP